MCDTVVSLRLGTLRAIASINLGVAISIFPVPQVFCILSGTSTILGLSGFSSFARQAVLVALFLVTAAPLVLLVQVR